MKLLSAAAAISACLLMSGNIMAQNIQIKVDDKAFTGELNNNDAAKDFAAKLPLKLKFRNDGTDLLSSEASEFGNCSKKL